MLDTKSPLKPNHIIKLPNNSEIHISSLRTAQLSHEGYAWVVSLLDPGAKPRFFAPNHQIYHVNDTEHPGPDDRLLTLGELERILALRLDVNQRGLVHCRAGVSRSTAIGIMLAHLNGASWDQIERGIDWHQADPNMLILGWSGSLCGVDLTVPVRERKQHYYSCLSHDDCGILGRRGEHCGS